MPVALVHVQPTVVAHQSMSHTADTGYASGGEPSLTSTAAGAPPTPLWRVVQQSPPGALFHPHAHPAGKVERSSGQNNATSAVSADNASTNSDSIVCYAGDLWRWVKTKSISVLLESLKSSRLRPVTRIGQTAVKHVGIVLSVMGRTSEQVLDDEEGTTSTRQPRTLSSGRGTLAVGGASSRRAACQSMRSVQQGAWPVTAMEWGSGETAPFCA
ncbi:hypothetical protein LSTR_LSTR015835 [Laodelphax striatellus]|uniref:Uncharacterized protein n=1 Tax=Laodelphax striatellus TaxID=195883 RepID=A0A482XE83_LAOST|nr:hypothetical protein LSTR_LSTR015835 [Laodelphax striatellus]